MKKIEWWIWRLLDATIFVTILGMVMLIVLQVGSRWLGGSLAWTEELSRFLFVWTIWLGMAAGFRQGQHPSLNFLSAISSPPIKSFLRFLQAAAATVFFSIVCWYGVELVQQQLRYGEVSATLQLGRWLTTVPLVLGSVLAILGAWMHTLAPISESQSTTSVAEDTL
ncbi:TRAP transporter small permease [Halomonas sp. MC140]|nr:TRAP transporter small permease [Halomonas sp. MC140]MDN7131227.1 TRAP transporter small permease [Halomonas sp. MC140]